MTAPPPPPRSIAVIDIDADSALAWLGKCAQPTEQVQKLLTQTGVWAQYESERSKPAVTKLSRRGYVTGKVAPGVKQPKPAPAADDTPADAAPAAIIGMRCFSVMLAMASVRGEE